MNYIVATLYENQKGGLLSQGSMDSERRLVTQKLAGDNACLVPLFHYSKIQVRVIAPEFFGALAAVRSARQLQVGPCPFSFCIPETKRRRGFCGLPAGARAQTPFPWQDQE